MTSKTGKVIVSLIIFVLVLTGCKMPASKSPETPEGDALTTPIRIKTDSNEPGTETGPSGIIATVTLGIENQPLPTDTPEPTEVVVIPTVTRPAEYTLMEGEFLYCIARRFNVNPEDLLTLNNLGPDDLLSPGTTIKIPQTGTWVGEGRVRNPHPTTHTVTTDETIYSIACFYGDVSPEAIIAVNHLEEPYDLTPGQKLSIP